VRCKWLLELAIAHAQCGEEQEATDYLEKACSSLPVEFENDLTALYADYAPHLCLWEGMAYLNLGYAARDMNHRDHAHAYYQQARNAFAQIDTAQPNKLHMVAGRIRAKILNQQAETALALKDLDACSHFLEKGAQAAKKLQSPLLQQEVRGLWRDACIRWSNEQRLKVLIRFFRKDA
jgi:tetratricopeptide (TPR) repeat protein